MIDSILASIPSDFPWKDRIHWFEIIDSTNTRAKALAAEKILEEIERQAEKENVKRPKPVLTKQASTKRKALPSKQKSKSKKPIQTQRKKQIVRNKT